MGIGRGRIGRDKFGQAPRELGPVVTGLRYVGDIAPGETLVIDCEAKTILLDGENVLKNLDEGHFPELLAGTNVFIYQDVDRTRNLAVQIAWSDRWL